MFALNLALKLVLNQALNQRGRGAKATGEREISAARARGDGTQYLTL